MHVVFYAYGIRREVEHFLEWLETRTVLMGFENPTLDPKGPKDKNGNLLRHGYVPINVGVRYGIFGTYEAIFPEIAKDEVLTVLRANEQYSGTADNSKWGNKKVRLKIAALRKALSLEPVPEFKIKNTLYMPERIGVRVIVVGVRYDREMILPNGLKHEGI